MKQTIFLFVTISLLSLSCVHGDQACDYTKLVDCFIEVLDDFTNVLWLSRTNIVMLTDENCEQVRQMGNCIDDTLPEDKKHSCTRQEVVDSSRSLSDLLMHRRNVGTFVKSYFLLYYACSEEGRALVHEHRECLFKESIGQATLSAASYLGEKYLEAHGPTNQEACEVLETRLNEYKTALAPLCGNGGAAKLMCESVLRAVQGAYPDKVGTCSNIDCKVDTEDEAWSPQENFDPAPTQNGNSARVANDGPALTPQSMSIALFSVLIAQMLR